MIIPDLVELEDGFRKSMHLDVELELENCMTRGCFKNSGVCLCYRKFQPSECDKTILIVHGFSEFTEKYNEMIYVLLKNNYTVYILELRGHGHSTREVENRSMVHVKNFSDYVMDIKYFYRNYIKRDHPECYILGQSMGGGIVARYIERYPYDFKKAVLTSPMVAMNAGRFPLWAVKAISYFMIKIGRGKTYALGQRDFDGISRLESSSCKSNERYEYCMDKRRQNGYYQTWGADYNWTYAACKNTEHLMKFASDIKTPLLILKSEADTTIEPKIIDRFANRIKNCQIKKFKHARHEIYNGTISERLQFYGIVLNFLNH